MSAPAGGSSFFFNFVEAVFKNVRPLRGALLFSFTFGGPLLKNVRRLRRALLCAQLLGGLLLSMVRLGPPAKKINRIRKFLEIV